MAPDRPGALLLAALVAACLPPASDARLGPCRPCPQAAPPPSHAPHHASGSAAGRRAGGGGWAGKEGCGWGGGGLLAGCVRLRGAGRAGGPGGGRGAFPGMSVHLPGEEEGDAERAARSPVIRIPGDFPDLAAAVGEAMSRKLTDLYGATTIVDVCAGSHLIPRKYKLVRRSKDGWQYYRSSANPRWVDGRHTLALIPDDGAEPLLSPNYPCQYLPTRDIRFFNITQPIQLVGYVGDDGETAASRLLGCWRLHLDRRDGGSFKTVAMINQEETVVFVVSGNWRFDECELRAAGHFHQGADILQSEGYAQVVMYTCTVEVLSRDEPGPHWAAWPPGSPLNGGGLCGESGGPAILNASPQDGYAMVGIHATETSKVIANDCRIRGCVVGAATRDSAEVSFDDCLFAWNQYGASAMEGSRLLLRSSRFEDNVYGAVLLFEEDCESTKYTQIVLFNLEVQGRLWASDDRPKNLEEDEVTVTESPESFTDGPGRHAKPGFFEEWVPKKWGEWKTNWTNAPGYVEHADEETATGHFMSQLSSVRKFSQREETWKDKLS